MNVIANSGVLLITVGSALLGLLSPPGPERRRERVDTLYGWFRWMFPGVREISAADVMADPSRYVLVDVRTDKEMATSIVPGAIPLDEFEARAEELSDQTVVVYCTIGYRSGLAAMTLAERGIDVRNLAGSLLAWTHAGGELHGEQGPTRDAHVFARPWGLAAEGYTDVW